MNGDITVGYQPRHWKQWEEAAAKQKLQEKWAVAFHEAAREGRTICLFAHPLWPGKLIMNAGVITGCYNNFPST